jgi:hypothetical protein
MRFRGLVILPPSRNLDPLAKTLQRGLYLAGMAAVRRIVCSSFPKRRRL